MKRRVETRACLRERFALHQLHTHSLYTQHTQPHSTVAVHTCGQEAWKKIATMVRIIVKYNLFGYTGRNDALDKKADFDEYTIYDQGQLNEYGLLKDAAKKKLEGGAGLDSKADFDEYTIYDQGMLVPSMLVRLRELWDKTMY